MNYLLLEKIQTENHAKICIFGAGKIGRTWAYDILTCAGFEIDCYCDNKMAADTEIREGVKTISFDLLCSNKEDYIIFVAINEKIQGEIKKQFDENGITNYVMMGFLFLQEFCESVIGSKDKNKLEQYRFVVDDKEFTKRQFRVNLGYELNIENPKTFNEKLQWLKLYACKPEYTSLVDKYEFKRYIEEKLGKEYIIPTLGVWDNLDDIDWNKLPEKFVLKCTHDSGSVTICKDKSNFDIEKKCYFLDEMLQHNYYWNCREVPYKNVKPRIIAEEYMQDGDSETLNVYKVFNFHGVPKLIQVIQNDKTPQEAIDYFTPKWELMKMRQNYPNSRTPLSKPKLLNQMLKLAEMLSEGFPFLRTDFYIVNEQIYVSEFTFYSDAGMAKFEPEEWDLILGDWMNLSDLNV